MPAALKNKPLIRVKGCERVREQEMGLESTLSSSSLEASPPPPTEVCRGGDFAFNVLEGFSAVSIEV